MAMACTAVVTVNLIGDLDHAQLDRLALLILQTQTPARKNKAQKLSAAAIACWAAAEFKRA